MITMSRNVKSIILFSAVGIAVGIGVTILIVYNPTVGTLFFQSTSDEDPLGYLTYYKTTQPVGEEGEFRAYLKFGKPPYSFEWKFSDGVISMVKTLHVVLIHLADIPLP